MNINTIYRVENIVRKGEIACYKHPFLTMFYISLERQNAALCGNGLTLYHIIPTLMTYRKKPFENIEGKGENAGNQHFILFPQCFLPSPKTNFDLSLTFILSSGDAFNLDQS